jgi:predicted nucleotidyltransferase
MGREPSGSGLADALFTPIQQRVLRFLFGQPDRRFQSSELIRLVNGGVGAVHRQLSRLEVAGLVEVTRVGNQKHYQARRRSPVFSELHGLVAKTVGIVDPLRDALSPMADQIRTAFVFGSVAKGNDHARSDIDLMVISDLLHYPDLFEALQQAEGILARPVNPTILGLADWRAKVARDDSFAARIGSQRKLFVIGSDDDLT